MTLFIKENNLSPFNLYKTPVKTTVGSIFKTRDGKNVYNRVLGKISDKFCFSDTSNILNCFPFTNEETKIKQRQEFFKGILPSIKNDFLKELKKPKATWKPNYGIVAVTDNEDTFTKLKNLDIPVKFLVNEDDVLDLENYEIIQVVDCDQFSTLIEQLPQSVFLDSIEDVYLERYLELLSGWAENLKILKSIDNEEVRGIISELLPVLELIGTNKKEKMSRSFIEEGVENINSEISGKIKDLNISGDALFSMLSENRLPKDIEKIISDVVKESNIPEVILEMKIPVRIDETELENLLRRQDSNENTDFAEKIKKNSKILKQVPEKIEKLSSLIMIYDFISGVSQFISDFNYWPEFPTYIEIKDSKNIFLENAQAISFSLNLENQCSILTGANSGGKTTLIEHVIQLIGISNIGLPVNGTVNLPIFTEVYYFAKNKGSASKGAFETLLSQMSEIVPGGSTIILADEIEAVTEPGVAGKIIAATAEYFISKNCFLIIATHLGYEIEKVLPSRARIDGIEAKGLSENNELIVDHNPVLGRLANSTPELIVEKMANSGKHDYFLYLNSYLKKNGFEKLDKEVN